MRDASSLLNTTAESGGSDANLSSATPFGVAHPPSPGQHGGDGPCGLGRDLIRLGPAQAEWRSESEDIALRHGPPDDPVGGQRGGDLRPDLLPRIEEGPAVALGHEFHRAEHPLAADIAHIGMIAQRVAPRRT